MDKQDTLRNLLVAAGVFLLAMTLAPYLGLVPTAPPPSTPTNGSTTPDSTAAQPGAAGPAAGQPGGPAATGRPSTDAAYRADEAAEAIELELGEAPLAVPGGQQPEASAYRLKAVLSNVGAAVAAVRLTDHAEHIREPQRYQLLAPLALLDGSLKQSFAVEKLNIDGHDVRLDDKRWQAQPVRDVSDLPSGGAGAGGAQEAEFTLDVLKGDQPELRLRRKFVLPKQPIESGRHDLFDRLTIESLSANPHRVVVTWRGPVRVPGTTGQFATQHIDYGVRTEGEQVVGSRKMPTDVAKAAGARLSLYRLSPENSHERLAWAAIDNTYFTATTAPLDPDGKTPAGYIAEVAAVDQDGNPETTEDVSVSFVTVAQELSPGGKLDFAAEHYLGEKDRVAFKTIEPYKSRNYYFQIAAGLTWCTFNWLVELMIWLLNGLYAVFRDFGIAIIILVLIVRAILHPITKKGQVNMVRMQQRMSDFAPKMEEIKKKYGSDKVKLQQETMKLYREQGINPAGQLLTCLPMMLQLPVWAALFYSLSNNILMRHQPLHFTWIHDLTAPDALIPFSTPFRIPIVGWQLESFNLLPLLVAVFMYIQQKTMPKPEPNPNMTEQQKAQQDMMQKMMVITPIIMILFFYEMPAGLNLYIMFSSVFGWLEQNRIRKHIKERKEAGTLHGPRAGPPAAGGAASPGAASEKPKGWLAGQLEKLQKAAEEAQKAQRTQRRDKPRGKR